MSSTADRLVRFSTDAFGLERILRLLQAIVQIIIAVPLLALRLTDRINSLPHQAQTSNDGKSPAASPLAVADTLGMLGDLRGRLNTSRRVLRLFRFAENFHMAQKLYFSTAPGKSLEQWLDISSRAFNGMKMIADLLDIALPGSALGWVPLDTLGVSSAMLVTTILTSLDFWEKCA
ncbi:hypothetical protein MAPG_07511 [Magnaporthiopsis poae ATCC 64411]|uniref:Peroxin 11B n=1 Tax=Magnaporthiopsis poae (strain ATCC 64411 / 73-15) TaxID=644358 RepID=A0A0C4E4V8_MAGP6|nr:hypothetical protein MAPG_07511 [Magnaporthiopsis poae ATCC 64411]